MKNSNNLNHLAVKVENSIGRLIAEKTSNTRSEFQRDREERDGKSRERDDESSSKSRRHDESFWKSEK